MKKIMLSMASIAVILVSCEKDETINPLNNQNANTTAEKVKASNNKSVDGEFVFPEGYWDGIDDFIYQINANDEYDSDLEANKALYYLESTIDWRLTGNTDDIAERTEAIEELTYILQAQQNGSEWYFNNAQITSINSTVYSDIADKATILSNAGGQDVLVDIIDFDWDLNNSTGEVELKVNALLGLINNGIQPFAPTCQLVDAKILLAQRCNGNTNSRTATQEVDFYLRNLCGTWNRRLPSNLSNKILINPVTSLYNALTPCGSYVDGNHQLGDCRTASDNQADFNDTRNTWNNACFPNHSTKFIRNAGYTLLNTSMPGFYNQFAVLNIADGYRTVCNQPFGCPPPQRPYPIF